LGLKEEVSSTCRRSGEVSAPVPSYGVRRGWIEK